MDLLAVFGVARRHWIIMLVGAALGCVVAFAVSFQLVDGGNGVKRWESRSHTVYDTSVQLLINEPGYGLGSAGLDQKRPDAFGKTLDMAPVYAQLVMSDAVMSEAASRTGGISEQVTAEAVEDCPIVKVKVSGEDPTRARKVATALGLSLGHYLEQEQVQNGVPTTDRLSVGLIAAPSAPVPSHSRSWELALLAFLSPVVAAGGLGFMLDRHRSTALSDGGTTPC